jgi:hypothetical protein
MMVVVPDDADSDDGKLLEDASDRTGSGGIVFASSSSSLRTRLASGGCRKSETTMTTTEKKRAHPRADFFELEARIEQIRGRYRQQERILEEEIARLEQTYRFALAELDKATGRHLSQADLDGDRRSTNENWDWETTSEYPPTEPRGMSRSPSPIFTYRGQSIC